VKNKILFPAIGLFSVRMNLQMHYKYARIESWDEVILKLLRKGWTVIEQTDISPKKKPSRHLAMYSMSLALRVIPKKRSLI
jgi:hypothetical protein